MCLQFQANNASFRDSTKLVYKLSDRECVQVPSAASKIDKSLVMTQTGSNFLNKGYRFYAWESEEEPT